MKARFLADANLNLKIVSGLLLSEPQIDFQLPHNVLAEAADDRAILHIAATHRRVLVTHDQSTMPAHFGDFVMGHTSAGAILVPKVMSIGDAIRNYI